LVASLKKQNQSYDLVIVDNSKNQYSSIPVALNKGAQLTSGNTKYLIFSHGDISFDDPSFLDKLEKQLDGLGLFGVAGAAGAVRGRRVLDRIVYTNITHGVPPIYEESWLTTKIPVKVQTLDECFIVVPRKIFEKSQFEATLVDHHLFSVEYCLRQIKFGFNIYVLPLTLYHRSMGKSLSSSFYDNLEKIFKKHHTMHIYATTGRWDISTMRAVINLFSGFRKMMINLMNGILRRG
jgi:hypothetical protein